MKKKMIAGLAVALTCGLGLAACGGTAKAALGAVDAQKYDLKSLTKIQLDGTLLNSRVSKNGFAISKKTVGENVQFAVTNVNTGAVVVPYAQVSQIKIIEAGAKDYFAVEKTNGTTSVTTYDIYDEAGVKVFSDVESYSDSGFLALKDGKDCYEIMSVNDYTVCYKQKGGNARTLYWSTQVEKGGYAWKSDVYCLALQTQDVKDIKYGIKVQPLSYTSDSDYKVKYVLYDLCKSKEIKSYSVDASIPSIDDYVNGNIIFQETVRVDNYAKDYDFVISGMKYKLNTYALNVKTGKTKKLSNKYIFEVKNGSIVADNIENNEVVNGVVAKAAVINKDKTVTKSTNVLVDKNLNFSELDYNYFNVSPVQKVAKDRYFAVADIGTESSSVYVYNIVDGSYEVKVNLENEPIAIADNGMIVENDDNKYAIIDFNGKLVTDYVYDDFVSVNGNYAMLTKETPVTENNSTITETRYYSVNTKTGAETLFATEKSTEYTLADGTKVNGITNHIIGGAYSLIHTEQDSTTVGNLVYTFYSASGAKLGEFDVKVGNVRVVTYGENNSKVLVMVGDVVLLAA